MEINKEKCHVCGKLDCQFLPDFINAANDLPYCFPCHEQKAVHKERLITLAEQFGGWENIPVYEKNKLTVVHIRPDGVVEYYNAGHWLINHIETRKDRENDKIVKELNRTIEHQRKLISVLRTQLHRKAEKRTRIEENKKRESDQMEEVTSEVIRKMNAMKMRRDENLQNKFPKKLTFWQRIRHICALKY